MNTIYSYIISSVCVAPIQVQNLAQYEMAAI